MAQPRLGPKDPLLPSPRRLHSQPDTYLPSATLPCVSTAVLLECILLCREVGSTLPELSTHTYQWAEPKGLCSGVHSRSTSQSLNIAHMIPILERTLQALLRKNLEMRLSQDNPCDMSPFLCFQLQKGRKGHWSGESSSHLTTQKRQGLSSFPEPLLGIPSSLPVAKSQSV